MAARRTYRGGAPPTATKRSCAWVVLLMRGSAYAPGALVAAESLRLARTAHAIVCTVTPDVPAETREQLLAAFDRVVEVPYLARPARALPSKKQAAYYSAWNDASFTKWQCLTLTEYDRVILVDADMAFLSNCDTLFDLTAPAACYSSPWAFPYASAQRSGMPNPYVQFAKTELAHGATVPAATILAALTAREPTFVGGGFLVLLKPDAADFARLVEMVSAGEGPYAAGYTVTSGADETSIAELYARAGVDWTNIHQRYAAIPWKKKWVDRDIRAYHYFGRKPWDSSPTEWPDLADWWRIAHSLTARAPALTPIFAPSAEAAPATKPTLLDACAADLRLTDALRRLVGGTRAGARLLSAWLSEMSALAAPGPLYRHTTLHDPLNNTLARGLIAHKLATRDAAGELVARVLAEVDARATPVPGGACVSIEGNGNTAMLRCGAYRTPLTDELRLLTVFGGPDAAAAVAMRYAAADPPPPGLDIVTARELYDLGARGEAFASPLTSALAGRPGAVYCSQYPDTDAPFGSLGSFLQVGVSTVDNWIVDPPPALAGAAAARVLALLDGPASMTFHVLVSAREPALADLRADSRKTAERRIDRAGVTVGHLVTLKN